MTIMKLFTSRNAMSTAWYLGERTFLTCGHVFSDGSDARRVILFPSGITNSNNAIKGKARIWSRHENTRSHINKRDFAIIVANDDEDLSQYQPLNIIPLGAPLDVKFRVKLYGYKGGSYNLRTHASASIVRGVGEYWLLFDGIYERGISGAPIVATDGPNTGLVIGMFVASDVYPTLLSPTPDFPGVASAALVFSAYFRNWFAITTGRAF